jgi:hypothetical protein
MLTNLQDQKNLTKVQKQKKQNTKKAKAGEGYGTMD